MWSSALMSLVARAPATHSRTTPAHEPPAKLIVALLTGLSSLSLTSNISDQ